METTKRFIGILRPKLKQGLLQWLEGFKEACCLHRVVFLCFRSRKLLVRTGQCFLLNGFIFLGSILVLKSVVIPTLLWILPDQCSEVSSQGPCSFDSVSKLYSSLRLGLIQLFYVFWFYPLYMFSFILSTIWYNDIAKYGFEALGKNSHDVLEPSSQNEVKTPENTALMDKPAGLGGVMIGIGEQVYSILLLTFFFLEVYATGFIPYIGKALNFVLLSWMYAYYCFEYKWNLSDVALDRRLDFFESNWAFFSGFGSPCVLAIFFFSPLVSYGVMAILYPLVHSFIPFFWSIFQFLKSTCFHFARSYCSNRDVLQFVLAATGSGAEQLIFSQRRKWKGMGLGRLPIFCAADTLSMWVLSLLPLDTRDQKQDKKAL